MISWWEWPKTVDAEWVPHRAKALPALPSCTLKQHMKYRGVEYNTAIRVQFGCITAHHHHLWAECKQKGCAACTWLNKHGVKHLSLHWGGGGLKQVWGPQKFHGPSNLENVCIIQPVLHNTKGNASRLLSVIGRTLPPESQHELLQGIAHVATRYTARFLPPDSREHRRLVRGRWDQPNSP